MTSPKRPLLAGLAALPLFLAACVSSPPPEVQALRAQYDEAARDPRVNEHAPLQLRDAGEALARLEATPRRDREEIAHYAYLTRQRITIAKTAADAGAFEGELAELGEQRDELRLSEREQEASTAIERARELEARLSELKAEQTNRGLVMTMSDVLFAFNSADLLPGAERLLGEVTTLLNEFPEREIFVEGHTDAVGGDEYNRELSRRRAEADPEFACAASESRCRLRPTTRTPADKRTGESRSSSPSRARRVGRSLWKKKCHERSLLPLTRMPLRGRLRVRGLLQSPVLECRADGPRDQPCWPGTLYSK